MKTTTAITAFLVTLGLMLSSTIDARGLRAPIINDDNAVLAKGDIPTPKKYDPVIDAYMKSVGEIAMQLETQVQQMLQSIKNNQLAQAQKWYIQAHQLYEQIRPIVALFGQVDQSLNTRADYYVDGVNDPNFVGFHLVEYDLFKLKDLAKAKEDAENLLYGVHDLRKRISIETIMFPKMVQSADDFMEMILDPKLLGLENQFSQSDLADIQANVMGSERIIQFLSPFIQTPSLQAIQQGFKQINAVLGKYKIGSGRFKDFSQLSIEDKSTLYSLVADQAERLSKLRSELKVDVYYKYQ